MLCDGGWVTKMVIDHRHEHEIGAAVAERNRLCQSLAVESSRDHSPHIEPIHAPAADRPTRREHYRYFDQRPQWEEMPMREIRLAGAIADTGIAALAQHAMAFPLMGLIAFLVLMSADVGLGAVFGRSLVDQLAAFKLSPGAIGLGAQVIFAMFPVLQGWRR